MRRSLALLLLSLTACAPTLDKTCLERVPPQVRASFRKPEQIEAALSRPLGDNAARREALVELFRAAGCAEPNLSQPDVADSKLPNVVCRLPGSSPEAPVIVVGAHYDKSEQGDGIADNWSGAALLPALYTSVASVSREHEFRFIGFSDEEVGLVGSIAYVEDLPEPERARIRAMVNLDTLGLGPTKVELSRSDPALVCTLRVAASVAQVDLGVVNADRVGKSDFASFARIGAPVLSVHSITQATFPILHTQRDVLAVINLPAYYQTYRLLAIYLAVLDGSRSTPSRSSASIRSRV